MILKIYKLLPAIWVGAFCSLPALAKSSQLSSFTPSFYVNASYGFSSYKSKLVASNDTSTGFNYELGGYAGRDAIFGFALKNSSTSTTFELNNSSNAISWQDTILKYRFSYIYLGPLFTTVSYKVNNQGSDTIEASGSGIGANVGLLFPISSKGAVMVDIVTVSPSQVVNKLTAEIDIKSRLDIDLSGLFPITRSIDFLSGYRQQTHQVTTDSTYKETYLLTYFGFQFSLSF